MMALEAVKHVAFPDGTIRPATEISRLVVEVPTKTKDALRKLAVRSGHNMTWVVNDLINQWLLEQKGKK
jgi:hypothetical protein